MKVILLFLIAFSTSAIPFNAKNWDIIEYRNIKPNQTKFKNNTAFISIDESAGSIIHTLKKPTSIKNIQLAFKHRGNLKSKKLQGEKGFDDYLLRIGIIYEGEKTLNFLERSFAADWLIEIFDKAPKGSGLSQIRFYNVISDKRILGKERVSPASKYMYEVFKYPSYEENGSLNINLDLDPNKKVIAIWLCFDGDDSRSKVDIELKNLKLK